MEILKGNNASSYINEITHARNDIQAVTTFLASSGTSGSNNVITANPINSNINKMLTYDNIYKSNFATDTDVVKVANNLKLLDKSYATIPHIDFPFGYNSNNLTLTNASANYGTAMTDMLDIFYSNAGGYDSLDRSKSNKKWEIIESTTITLNSLYSQNSGNINLSDSSTRTYHYFYPHWIHSGYSGNYNTNQTNINDLQTWINGRSFIVEITAINVNNYGSIPLSQCDFLGSMLDGTHVDVYDVTKKSLPLVRFDGPKYLAGYSGQSLINQLQNSSNIYVYTPASGSTINNINSISYKIYAIDEFDNTVRPPSAQPISSTLSNYHETSYPTLTTCFNNNTFPRVESITDWNNFYKNRDLAGSEYTLTPRIFNLSLGPSYTNGANFVNMPTIKLGKIDFDVVDTIKFNAQWRWLTSHSQYQNNVQYIYPYRINQSPSSYTPVLVVQTSIDGNTWTTIESIGDYKNQFVDGNQIYTMSFNKFFESFVKTSTIIPDGCIVAPSGYYGQEIDKPTTSGYFEGYGMTQPLGQISIDVSNLIGAQYVRIGFTTASGNMLSNQVQELQIASIEMCNSLGTKLHAIDVFYDKDETIESYYGYKKKLTLTHLINLDSVKDYNTINMTIKDKNLVQVTNDDPIYVGFDIYQIINSTFSKINTTNIPASELNFSLKNRNQSFIASNNNNEFIVTENYGLPYKIRTITVNGIKLDRWDKYLPDIIKLPTVTNGNTIIITYDIILNGPYYICHTLQRDNIDEIDNYPYTIENFKMQGDVTSSSNSSNQEGVRWEDADGDTVILSSSDKGVRIYIPEGKKGYLTHFGNYNTYIKLASTVSGTSINLYSYTLSDSGSSSSYNSFNSGTPIILGPGQYIETPTDTKCPSIVVLRII